MDPCPEHPDREAVDTCASCRRPLCTLCVHVLSGRTLCSRCKNAASRRSTGLTAVVAVGAVAALGAGGVWLAMRAPTGDAPASVRDAGVSKRHSKKVREAIARSEAEPCNRSHAFSMLNQLVVEAHNREAIERANQFWERCGDNVEFRRFTYTAHHALNEHEAAVAEVTKLIEARPQDQDYYWWRGVVYEEMGKHDLAEADFRRTLEIEPRVSSIPFNLANLLEKTGRPCEAIAPIEQYLYFHPKGRSSPKIRARLNRLYETEGCELMAGEGNATVRFPPGSKQIRARVKINGVALDMVVDTGATDSIVSKAAAKKVGLLKGTAKQTILIGTAGGRTIGVQTAAKTVSLQGCRARHVSFTVLEHLDKSLAGDGLLGMSFLSRFKIEIDNAKGRLRLRERDR